MTIVTRTLEESTGVSVARFDEKTSVWTVSTAKDFNAESVSQRIRAAGEDHGRRVGRPNDPAWMARWITSDGQQPKD